MALIHRSFLAVRTDESYAISREMGLVEENIQESIEVVRRYSIVWNPTVGELLIAFAEFKNPSGHRYVLARRDSQGKASSIIELIPTGFELPRSSDAAQELTAASSNLCEGFDPDGAKRSVFSQRRLRGRLHCWFPDARGAKRKETGT